jgi:L-lactate dehydrogenase (cytochrome)
VRKFRNLKKKKSPILKGRRERDLRAKLAMQEPDAVDAHMNTQADPKEGRITVLNSFVDATLNWDDIAWFKSVTNMPIVIKGVQTAEDTVLAAKYGCQGVVLSNHGGRQLDFAPSGIEILPETMDALKREGIDTTKFEVYVDGGIRRGSDIFKALALGAKGVGIGRPALVSWRYYKVGS